MHLNLLIFKEKFCLRKSPMPGKLWSPPSCMLKIGQGFSSHESFTLSWLIILFWGEGGGEKRHGNCPVFVVNGTLWVQPTWNVLFEYFLISPCNFIRLIWIKTKLILLLVWWHVSNGPAGPGFIFSFFLQKLTPDILPNLTKSNNFFASFSPH